MRTKIITLILILTLALTGKVEAFTLTQKLGSEYIETTVEKDEQVRMIFTSKDGFRFRNWVLLEGNININVSSNDITFSMPNENVTIEAKYDSKYEITFHSNDGTERIASMTIIAGRTEKLIANPFAREGYIFKGWSTAVDETVEYLDEADCNPESNLPLYAVWQVAEVTVIFSSDGNEIGRTEVIYGETYVDLPTPTKTGYTLDGWYKENGTKVINGTEVTEMITHTLYARWTANKYYVKYNGNGNTGGSMSNSEHTYGTSSNLRQNAFTRTGYTFAGWAESANGSVKYADKASVSTLATSGTKNLYAKWTANIYTVKYNANGGSGSMSNSEHTYDTSSNLTENAFTRTGWTFAGWATTESGAVTYENGQSIINLTGEANKTITLYAKWHTSTSTTLSAGDYIILNCGPESVSVSTAGGTNQPLSVKNSEWFVFGSSNGAIKVISASSLGDLTLSGKVDYNRSGALEVEILDKLVATGIFSDYADSYPDDLTYDASFDYWVLSTHMEGSNDFHIAVHTPDGTAWELMYDYKNYTATHGVSAELVLSDLAITEGDGSLTHPYVVEMKN